MTGNKHFKQLVRARMARTGESYAAAALDLSTRRQIAVLDGHRDAVVALDLSPDGTHALTGGYDGHLRRWHLARAECVQEVRSSLERVAAVAHVPNSQLTLEAGQGPIVTVRRVDTGEPVSEFDTGAVAVIGLAVAPGGAMIATAGYDGTVALWASDTWEVVRELAAGDRANAVTFSRSGRLVAVAARGRVSVWADRDDDAIATVELPIEGVYALAFSRDARRLAQTGADGKVRIWTLRPS